MTPDEAVERAAAEHAICHDYEGEGDEADNAVAKRMLDESGYPQALSDAAELLRRHRHREATVLDSVECDIDGQPWPCDVARWLSEHAPDAEP